MVMRPQGVWSVTPAMSRAAESRQRCDGSPTTGNNGKQTAAEDLRYRLLSLVQAPK